MNFTDAVKIAEANQHLIGKIWKEATIDEIIIAPTDSALCSEFERLYIQSLNAQKSIVPFINSDVEVFVVFDKHRIRTQNLIVYTSIHNLPNQFNVVLNK